MALPSDERILDDTLSHLTTIPECDRWMDRQKNILRQHIARYHSIVR